jgi:hypothetical protein
MPLLIWLSACSYWHRVNAEMTRATLQFFDHVERQNCPQSKAARISGDLSGAAPDTKMCLGARANSPARLNFEAWPELTRPARIERNRHGQGSDRRLGEAG